VFSPIRRSKIVDDLATKEVVRLAVRPGSPRRKLGKIELSDEEFSVYQRDAGQIAHGLVADFVTSRKYKKLDDEDKSEGINRLFIKARKQARETLKRDLGKNAISLDEFKRTL